MDKYIRLTNTSMIVYSPYITARLRYTSGFIGDELGQTILLTDKRKDLARGPAPRINYSSVSIEGEDIWVKPQGLLSEQGIRAQRVECFEADGLKRIFQTSGHLSFDIFAAVFYLLSRYEEWLPHRKDSYGRYAHENSIAFREDFLNRPLINEWLQEFANRMNLPTPGKSRFIPTYDIDEAFSFRHKNWKRIAGAAIKDLLKANWKRLKFRRDVMKEKTGDPFDSYEWMDALHQQYKLEPRYFFLLAERTGKYDRNILPAEKALQELVRAHAKKYKLGIHPSWQSGEDEELLTKEIKTLSAISGKEIIASRQHFIRFTLPQTYRRLIDAGIKEDYSMGYGSINGFRASAASPFYWYDLEKEEQTSLLLYPFCYMEANSFYEQKLSPQQALEEMHHYHKVVKAVNGMMITIWHNTFLGTEPCFEGWREVYAEFIREVLSGS
jgi:hypothetical protein